MLFFLVIFGCTSINHVSSATTYYIYLLLYLSSILYTVLYIYTYIYKCEKKIYLHFPPLLYFIYIYKVNPKVLYFPLQTKPTKKK